MSASREHRDEQFYRELLVLLATASDWTRTPESPTVDDAVARAATGSLGEVFYRYRPTAALLHVRIPDEGTPGALDALLNYPLDPQITERGRSGSFTAALSNAHQRIAERHGTAYIEVHADPSLILTVTVPFAYDVDVWQETITAIGMIVESITRLHTSIEQSVLEFEPDAC